MEMTTYQWVTLGLGALGFVGTWILMAFKLGQAVEQMKASVKEQIDDEREKIIDKINAMETRFVADQKTQDHNYGEVGHAMREKIAKVENKIREVELWGRDNYVQKTEFEKATGRLEVAISEMGDGVKDYLRERLDDLRKVFETKH